MIITICGSITLAEEIRRVSVEYSLQNHIVLTPILADRELTEYEIVVAKKLHYDKIKLSDFVILVVRNDRIGEHTQREIDFAERLGLYVQVVNV